MNKKNNTDDPFRLRNARAHEICGPMAHCFAAIMAGKTKGQVVWIDETQHNEQLLPGGLQSFCDPSRIIFARGANQIDVLWMAEECLRSGTVPVTVTRLSQSLDFTQGRRLQLAAETGRSLGLFLVPEGAGCNVAQTRWHCASHYEETTDSTLQHWQLIKNKQGTLGSWIIDWDEQTHHIIVVPQTGKRAVSAGAYV